MEQGDRRASRYLAERLRSLRVERGWSARHLAELCADAGLPGLTRGTIAKIESGVRESVTFDEAVVLAYVFDVELADLAPVRPGSVRRRALGGRRRVPRRSSMRIGLWGAPGSGKTTFLAALNIAVARSPVSPWAWRMVGVDEDAVNFSADVLNRLVARRSFPIATEAREFLSWDLFGDGGRQGKVEIELGLMDLPGEFYRRPDRAPNEVYDYLATCDGLLYMFDPTNESAELDPFNFFGSALMELARRARANGTLSGGRLPQKLAVCITKLDAPHVLVQAQRLGLLETDLADAMRRPRLSPQAASDFFRVLCDSSGGSADLVLRGIQNYFDQSNVSYFGTSSIGFWVQPGSVFDFRDFANIGYEDGHLRVRGQIHPVNVLEPIVWMHERNSNR